MEWNKGAREGLERLASALQENGHHLTGISFPLVGGAITAALAELDRVKAALDSLETDLTNEMAKTITRQGDRVNALKAESEKRAERIKKLEGALQHAINRNHDFSRGCSGCSGGVEVLIAAPAAQAKEE